jgi:hypothetical protein
VDSSGGGRKKELGGTRAPTRQGGKIQISNFSGRGDERSEKDRLRYIEYSAKMTVRRLLFGHRPQKRSQEGGCVDAKLWYREALSGKLCKKVEKSLFELKK